MTTTVDQALLLAEGTLTFDGNCPVCGGQVCAAGVPRGHGPGCQLDLALAERGFDTREARNAARERLAAAHAGTEPPPAP